MKHLTLSRALGCALLVLPVAAAQAKGTDYRLHLQMARQLVEDLREQTINGQLTNAQGKPLNSYATTSGDSYIKLKQDGNTFNENYSKCSSFVNRILERAYNWDWEAKGATTSSPNAAQFAQLIRDGVGLNRVNNFLAVKPGDIIAIDYLGTSSDSSGHVMILNRVLWTEPASYLGETVYWISVVDCSRSVHAIDTRILPNGTVVNGAGRGIMGVRVDSVGNILGHFWTKTMKATTYKPQTMREMVIGRISSITP